MNRKILFTGGILLIGGTACRLWYHYDCNYLWFFFPACILLMSYCGILVCGGAPVWRQLGLVAMYWTPLFVLLLPDEFCFNGCDHWRRLLFGIPLFWCRSMIPWLLYWLFLRLLYFLVVPTSKPLVIGADKNELNQAEQTSANNG